MWSAQGDGVMVGGGNASYDSLQPPVQHPAVRRRGRGGKDALPIPTDSAGAISASPRGQVASAGRPIWSCPPTWLYLPHLGLGGGQELQPPAPSASPSTLATAGGGPCAVGHVEIRGQMPSPGSRSVAVTSRPGSDDAMRTCATRRSDLPVAAAAPGNRALANDATDNAAARRLAERNAGIAISLAHHAERVGLKDARGRRPLEQTASERLAALRRRIGARCAAAGDPGPPGVAGEERSHTQMAASEDGHGALPLPTSNEDDKIHHLQVLQRIRMTTACLPSRGHSGTQLHRGEGGEHGGSDGSAWGAALREEEGTLPPAGEADTAASAAAAQAAWHSNYVGARGGSDAAVLVGASGGAWHSAPAARAAPETQLG